MATMFDAANWFLAKQPMNHKKLQKLCYYTQAWSHTLYGKPFDEDASFEAWVHGPVYKKLYEKYSGSGWNDVKPDCTEPPVFSEKELDLLESVYVTYGDMSANSLEVLTHREKPWQAARENVPDEERGCKKIDPQIMKEYYSSIYIGDDK